MKKSSPRGSLHPFDDQPFEVFHLGSWRSVERLRISEGAITFNFTDFGYQTEQKGFLSTLRLRRRRATMTDCTFLLRPGVEVCALSTPESSENQSEESNKDWFDGRISSIKRTTHMSRCDCQFYIRFFDINGHTGVDRKRLRKDVEVVGIDQISIFQSLELYPSENTYYRWNFAQTSTSLSKNKLFQGNFARDISWLLVASVQKQTVFDVRSIENKLVYHVLDGNFVSHSSSVHMNAVNFKIDSHITFSTVFSFASVEKQPPLKGVKEEVDPIACHENVELRRSKRRNVQPERYMGDVKIEVTDTTPLRFGFKRHGTIAQVKDEIMSGSDFEDHHQNFEQAIGTYGIEGEVKKELVEGEAQLEEDKVGKDLKRKRKSKRKDVQIEKEKKHKQVKRENDPEFNVVQKKNTNVNNVQREKETNVKKVCKERETVNDDEREIAREQSHLLVEMRSNTLIDDDNKLTKHIRSTMRAHRRPCSKMSTLDGFDDEPRYGGGSSYNKVRPRGRKYYPLSALRRGMYSEDSESSSKKALDICAYKDLISTYMKNIQLTIENKQPISTDAWKNLQGTQAMYEKKAAEEALPQEEEEESETEILFREMELCLATTYYFEDEITKDKGGEDKIEKFLNADGQSCRHIYIVNDEIGILCKLCGYVITEIRDVSPPFMQSGGGSIKYDHCNRNEKDDTEHKLLDEACADLVYNPASSDTPSAKSNENVWNLIPNIRNKLHEHQKKAFEFLWRNLAGSLKPSEMEPTSKKVGGCVISHTPGAGKTFLIIAFLVTYLKLFPGKRPLVLAPKTTLYTWYKEIIKWEFPVPVYQIHGQQTYRNRIYMQKVGHTCSNVVPNVDIMHVLDCLEKIQKWHAHPSVLIMGYTSFMSLMRKDSKYAHRRYMGQILRESPGILILDEGHNPRSTRSRLRKALMGINTEFRILLSGTLFQNNFGEYFNTLSLARPKFVGEVLRVLDPKYRKKIKGQNKTRTSIENRARKVFMDIIAKKIDSSVPEERVDGLNMLKNITNKFIDVYEGGSSENLPGLQSYTLMMKPTPLQQELLARFHGHMNVARGFPLEIELLITLGCIHPWLIKSAVCAKKFMSLEELQSLDEYKLDPTKGSKVRFVLGLARRSTIRREKVLIFCHNIAPINLFVELFEKIFGWRKGHDVLVLQGDLELFERGKVIDKFEERGGPSKVLLASINACAEGITLTAASRVVLLDSEWNPSKQKQAIARAFRPGQEKVVYVYQLLATGTLEEGKYGRTTWKEWVSCMIFSEELVEDPSKWQAEKIEDALLREIIEEDHAKMFHMIMKNEKTSYENPLKVINEE